jgi:ferrous iron transport protein B
MNASLPELEAARPPAPPRPLVVALAGRQNAGKTSLLMHLSGSVQKPVNFPGSSVERAEATTTHRGQPLRLVDLPGIASLHSVSPDEAVAVDFLRTGAGSGHADVAVVAIDACKLTVELKLLEEILTLGLRVVLALTKNDVAIVDGRPVGAAALSRALEVPVVEVNAATGAGKEALLDAILAAAHAEPAPARAIDPDAIARAAQPESDRVVHSLTDRIDAVLLHPLFGLPILALIVFGIFQLIFSGADPFISAIESAQSALGDAVSALIPAGALQSFFVDGLINGVGSIVVFLPQIIMLVALVTALEASGYMARAAFVLDRLLSRVGLSGRSFVPMAGSFACAVPGILSARIIDDERDRIATIVTAPLMSCSARLPVYVVLIGACFAPAAAGLVMFTIYVMGVVVAAAVAWMLRRTVLRGPHSALMMELPVYQRPSLRVLAGQVWLAVREFLRLAGTVIFATALIIWLLSYYPRPAAIHDGFEARRAAVAAAEPTDAAAHIDALDAAERTAYLEQSWLSDAGRAIQPIFAPAGFDWRVSVGILAAFPARELIIPTLGILYNAGDVDPGDYDLAELASAHDDDGLRARLRAATDADGSPTFTPLVAMSLMIFFAFCSQCMATLATIRRETRSWRWPIFTFSYMTVLAWLAAVLVYQLGTAMGWGTAGA